MTVDLQPWAESLSAHISKAQTHALRKAVGAAMGGVFFALCLISTAHADTNNNTPATASHTDASNATGGEDLSLPDSPITNDWHGAEKVLLDAEEIIIQKAVEGRSYHHHPHILALNDMLYATFSSGLRNEDDVGQQVMFTRSGDRGATWTSPRAIVLPPQGTHAEFVATATGLHAWPVPGTDKHLIVAYYGLYEYMEEGLDGSGTRKPVDAAHLSTKCMAVCSLDGGESWGEPVLITDGVVANLGPRPTRSGRLIMPSNAVYLWTDDPTGTSGWQWSSLPGLPRDHVDDSAGFQWALHMDPEAFGYCEGSFFQTPGGTLHMMLRTNRDRLAVTESLDDGETWSPARGTDYSDNGSRHQFGQLPDGRFFGLSTPDPDAMWSRTPLVVAISKDGFAFNRHFVIGDAPVQQPRFEGMFKGGRYGYPHMAVIEDTVVVIYSVAKEDIAVSRFPLAALGE